MNAMRLISAVLLILCRFGALGQIADSQRPDFSRAVQFIHHLQTTLRKDDREEMSRLIEYPLLVRLHGKGTRIRTRTEFLAHYDEIFDWGIRCELLATTDADISGNSHGFMVKDGALWFDDFSPPGTNEVPSAPDFWTKGTFKVMTVNNESFYPCKK